MDCVCGCGRNVGKDLADRNFVAAAVAIELLAWDKNRALADSGPEGREGLIARGVECYEKLLYSLHGEDGDPDAECDAWLRESRALRATRSDMTKRRFFGNSAAKVSKEDMARLDRRHPAQSFTASASTAPADDHLVAKLERLRVLRDDDVLTDEEFAVAKARLLGHG